MEKTVNGFWFFLDSENSAGWAPTRERTIKLPPPVKAMPAKEIRAIRARLGCTQLEFAPARRGEPPPRTPSEHRAAIAAAAQELNELRERWLNPPEWTETRTLEFPGSAHGPWARYVHQPDTHGIGMVRYPRQEPRDADCAAKLKKRTLTNLYNERPAWLDLAHKRLDAAAAAAYGWPADLSDEQILEKLLALNLERAAAEKAQAAAPKKRSTRTKSADEML